MNSDADFSTPRAVTFDGGDGNDWGVNWPSIEDAVRHPISRTEVKREANY